MKTSKLLLGLSLGCISLFGPTMMAQAAPGDLDTSFDGDGKLSTNLGAVDAGFGITTQSDGKIIVAGVSDNNSYGGHKLGIVRYNTDGSLDTTFDTDGRVTYPSSTGDAIYQARQVKALSNGKILVGGTIDYPGGGGVGIPGQPPRSDVFLLARFNSNGSLDTTFGSSGRVEKLVNHDSYGMDFVVQSDGKIVMVGYNQELFSDEQDFAIARFNSNGSLDESFGDYGTIETDLNNTDDKAYGVALDSSGNIVVVGTMSGDIAVARYTSAGQPDLTFSGNGKLGTDLGTTEDYAYGVVVQSDGKIVVSGGGPDMTVVRYNSNGTLDTSFSANGKVSTSFGTAVSYGSRLALDSNGKIVVSGYVNNDFAVARFTTTGVEDTTFSGDGRATAAISGIDYAYAIAIQSDGKIVLAGTSQGSDGGQVSVARFLGDALPSSDPLSTSANNS